jgi:hypothetical protein
LSGKLSQDEPAFTDLIAADLANFGQVVHLDSLAGAWVKHAAQGAALLADGSRARLVEHLGLGQASGTSLDWLHHPRAAQVRCAGARLAQLFLRCAGALQGNFDQQRMPAKRLRQPELNLRVTLCQRATGLRQIALNMHAGRQEVRNHDDLLGAQAHAALGPLRNRRLRKFYVGSLHMAIMPACVQLPHNVEQISICLWLPAAMRD